MRKILEYHVSNRDITQIDIEQINSIPPLCFSKVIKKNKTYYNLREKSLQFPLWKTLQVQSKKIVLFNDTGLLSFRKTNQKEYKSWFLKLEI